MTTWARTVWSVVYGDFAGGAAAPVDAHAILRLRLANQHLVRPELSDPGALVEHLLAVQSQDYSAAKWGSRLRLAGKTSLSAELLGQRLRDATDATVERAFNTGAILRTHVLRPTWHFVTPADICWMLALTAPRIAAAMAADRRGIDGKLRARTNAALACVLEGSPGMTRTELSLALGHAGIAEAAGEMVGPLLLGAELDALICSGPRRDKQNTYALLAERVRRARRLERDEALAELSRRHFTSHGPATLRDCSWWSGLTIGDIRRGLDQVRGQLQRTTVDGLTYWFVPGTPPPMRQRVYLLPNYDEFTVAFRDRDLYFDATRHQMIGNRRTVPFDNAIVVEGRVAGVWRRTFAGTHMDFQATWFDPPTGDVKRAYECEIGRVGAFYGLQARAVE